MKYFVEVYVAGVPPRRHEVSEGRGSLGTGSQDIVELPQATGAASGELEIEVDKNGVELSLTRTSHHSELLAAGKSCTRARLDWSDEAFLGSTRLCFVRVEQKGRAISPIVPIAGLLILFVAAALILGAAPVGTALSEAEPPSLLVEKAECSQKEPAAASTYGQELLARARAKTERYPYSRADGVEAYALYREGLNCLAQTQSAPERKVLEVEVASWGEFIESEYGNLQLRLEIALRKQRPHDALPAARALEELIVARDPTPTGDYWKWLQSNQETAAATGF